jgi:transposase
VVTPVTPAVIPCLASSTSASSTPPRSHHSNKVTSLCPRLPTAPLLALDLRSRLLCFVAVWSSYFVLLYLTNEQEYCTVCGVHLPHSFLLAYRHQCIHCYQPSSPSSSASPATPFSSPTPPTPLFDRELHSHLPLSPIERSAAVVLTRIGETQQQAADRIGTTRQTAAHWQHTFEETRDIRDALRSGRPRETTELEDEVLVAVAVIQPFTTPRQLKRKLEMDVSPRTLDRRLIEGGLPGRVAVHKYELTEEHIRKRLSFAEGYNSWTEEQWDRVLFSDEKTFLGKGFSGRVWVRRPPGEALKSEYCVDKKPHPVKVNMWGCFTGRGLGYSYIFNQTLDAKLLKIILNTHLLPSAHLHYQTDPPEQWWYLQDNDPKHTSREIKAWLHNNGISCLDFPPYSPDLNPIENLWNDIARRVEVKEAETVEQLQDILAAEWATTSTDLLTKLTHSMPKRCKLVIEAKGGHINY